MVKRINTEEFNALNKTGLQVFDFNATWCGPCKMLAPILEEVSEKYSGKAEFFAIDTDENADLAEKFSIMSIPCVIFMKDGKRVDKSIGLVTKDALAELIDKNL